MPSLYHITPGKYLDNILVEGLLPNRPSGSGMCSHYVNLDMCAIAVRNAHPDLRHIETDRDGKTRPIWLAESFPVVFGYTGAAWIKDNKAVLLEVDVDGLQIVAHMNPLLDHLGHAYNGEYMCFSAISADRLKVIKQPRLPRGYKTDDTYFTVDMDAARRRAKEVLGSAFCP